MAAHIGCSGIASNRIASSTRRIDRNHTLIAGFLRFLQYKHRFIYQLWHTSFTPSGKCAPVWSKHSFPARSLRYFIVNWATRAVIDKSNVQIYCIYLQVIEWRSQWPISCSIYRWMAECLIKCNNAQGNDWGVTVKLPRHLSGRNEENTKQHNQGAHVQACPGAHPASCTMGTGSFPGVKRPERGADHPPPSSAKVKRE
jgi:hypothetical protein